ncbi:MAG: methyl-accepting chemotaxis protein [Candidatus Eisenbacteria bacterium]
MLSRISVSSKVLLLVLVVMGFGLLALPVGWLIVERISHDSVAKLEAVMLDGHRVKLRALSDTQALTIATGLESIDDEEERIEYIRAMCKDAWYQATEDEEKKSGYFFCYTKDGVNVALPPAPEKQGKSLWNVQDQKGTYLIRELSSLAQAGGGFLEYYWEKPPANDVQLKLGYARMIPGSDYWIGTGIYIDDIEVQKADAEGRVAAAVRKYGFFGGLTLAAYLLLFVVPLSLLLVRSIRNPIRSLVERMQDIAEGDGDLTLRVDDSRGDELGELGRWFNTFVGKVHDIVRDVYRSSVEVASAATEIAASSEEMANSLELQSQQVGSINRAVEQMNQSAGLAASKVQVARSEATDAGAVAQEGGGIVRETIAEMQAIEDAVSSSAHSVKELGDRSAEIGRITSVIQDIADQTNLLALNAAIEAARAGEHGRGFAVVADEVRQLADRTTTATREIAESITAIQTETKRAVERMTLGTEQVARGMEQSSRAGESLTQIVSKASAVEQVVTEIASMIEQQAASSSDIVGSTETMRASSMEAYQGSHQAAEAAGLLSEKAEELQRLVSAFKLDLGRTGS